MNQINLVGGVISSNGSSVSRSYASPVIDDQVNSSSRDYYNS